MGPELGLEAQGTNHCTILPPLLLAILDSTSHIGCKGVSSGRPWLVHQNIMGTMLTACQVGRERAGGRGGEGHREGEMYSFPLDGSIFCHAFRKRCRTGH